METVLLIALTMAVLALPLVVLGWPAIKANRLQDRLVARRAILNLKSGQAIDALLTDVDGEYYFLRNAQLLEDGLTPAAMDGEVLVHLSEVDFIQYP